MTDKQKAYRILRGECIRFVIILAGGFSLGFITGYAYTGLVLALLVLLARYLFTTIALILWVFLGKDPGFSSGHIIYTIIDRIQAIINQQQLRKKQATNLARGFRDLLRALPDAIVLIDKDYKIEWLSDRASQLLPLEKTDVGNVMTALIRKPDFVAFVQSRDFRDVTPVISITTDYLRYLRVHKVVYNANSDLLVFRDITRVYQLQQRQASFIAHASHELNTPLTVIRGYAELAQRQSGQKQQSRKLLQKTIEETDRMARLTRDLLTLASLDQISSDVVGKWFQVVTVIESVSKKLQEIEAYRGRSIELDVKSNLLLRARETDISTVFANIIENALKYSDEDVTVSWDLAQDGSGVFAVTDKGDGIDNSHIYKLSDRFYRVPQSGVRSDPGGTGLGLSIVQAVLKIYSGELHIESRLGEGSSFICVFPDSIVKEAN